jgi:hypothetical protein
MKTKKKVTSKEKPIKRLAYAFEEILAYYGITVDDYRVIGAQIRMICPIHSGDNRSAFVWRGEYGCWTCYTEQCHKVHGSSAFGFIVAMEGGDTRRAMKVAKQLLADHRELIISRRHHKRYTIEKVTHNTQESADEIARSRFIYSTYPIERGIPRDIQERYRIGIYKDLYPDKIGFPVFARSGRIVGITLRNLHASDYASKWIHKPTGYKSSINLYNIHRATPRNGTIIITEGPVDVLKLVASGISNCVASFGCHLSYDQIELLKKIGAYKVILAYDDDSAGERGTGEAAKLLELHGMEVWKLTFGNGYNDFGEMPICHIKSRKWKLGKIS